MKEKNAKGTLLYAQKSSVKDLPFSIPHPPQGTEFIWILQQDLMIGDF